VKCVVDLAATGDLVGVEILDFRRQLSGAAPPPHREVLGMRWSYDSEVDAFYVRVGSDNGVEQVVTEGRAIVDAHTTVVALEVPVARP